MMCASPSMTSLNSWSLIKKVRKGKIFINYKAKKCLRNVLLSGVNCHLCPQRIAPAIEFVNLKKKTIRQSESYLRYIQSARRIYNLSIKSIPSRFSS